MTNNSLDLAIFLPSLQAGGAKRVMLTVAEELSERGYSVEFVLAEEQGEFIDKVPTTVSVVSFDTRVLWSLPHLVKYLRQREPHTLLASTASANIVAAIGGKIARIETKIVLREATVLSQQTKEFDSLKEKTIPIVSRLTYPLAHHYIAVSNGVRNDLIEYIGVNPNSATTIYNPTDLQWIKEQAAHPVKHSWFDEDIPVIIGIGRLTEQKDFFTLLRAVAQIQQSGEVRLLILGEGHLKDDLEQLSRDLNIEDVVELIGYVDNPYPLLANSDVFVLSSAWEGLPNVIIEALCCGTPVVATDCESGPREILKDGKIGKLIPVSDHKRMAEAIELTIENPIPSSILEERAVAFDVTNTIQDYAELLFE